MEISSSDRPAPWVQVPFPDAKSQGDTGHIQLDQLPPDFLAEASSGFKAGFGQLVRQGFGLASNACFWASSWAVRSSEG